MDKYGNAIYLTPMVLGALASIFAAAWKFLRTEESDTKEGVLDSLYGFSRQIRTVDSEAELSEIEEKIEKNAQGAVGCHDEWRRDCD